MPPQSKAVLSSREPCCSKCSEAYFHHGMFLLYKSLFDSTFLLALSAYCTTQECQFCLAACYLCIALSFLDSDSNTVYWERLKLHVQYCSTQKRMHTVNLFVHLCVTCTGNRKFPFDISCKVIYC